MPLRSLFSDPILIVAALTGAGLLGASLRAIVRQVTRGDRVTADSLIRPPRPLYTTCDPDLRLEAARRRERVEDLQRRAQRVSAGAPLTSDVVPLRQRRSS